MLQRMTCKQFRWTETNDGPPRNNKLVKLHWGWIFWTPKFLKETSGIYLYQKKMCSVAVLLKVVTYQANLLWDITFVSPFKHNNRFCFRILSSQLLIHHKHYDIHPGRLSWNLRIHPWKRKTIFQTIFFRFHVNLRGGVVVLRELFLLLRAMVNHHGITEMQSKTPRPRTTSAEVEVESSCFSETGQISTNLISKVSDCAVPVRPSVFSWPKTVPSSALDFSSPPFYSHSEGETISPTTGGKMVHTSPFTDITISANSFF